MLIRKLFTRKTDLSYSQYSTTNILKDTDGKQNGRVCRPIFREYFKKYCKQSMFAHLKSVWLVKSFRMSIRWALNKFEFWLRWWGGWPFEGPGGTKSQSSAAIFGQRVSGMAGNLVLACQLAHSKSAFLDTLTSHRQIYTIGTKVFFLCVCGAGVGEVDTIQLGVWGGWNLEGVRGLSSEIGYHRDEKGRGIERYIYFDLWHKFSHCLMNDP